MLVEFINFVDSVLPSVSPDFRDGAKNAILQFERDGEQLKYMMNEPLDDLSQGDIISKVPFSYFGDDGKQRLFTADAFVLSTSCHIDQKGRIVLCPVLPISGFKGNIDDLQKNTIFDFMYIPDNIMKDNYIDFEYMGTYSRDLIFRGLSEGRIERIGSLNQLGYYFFIIKLTVYLMRKEDKDTLNRRNQFFSYR